MIAVADALLICNLFLLIQASVNASLSITGLVMEHVKSVWMDATCVVGLLQLVRLA